MSLIKSTTKPQVQSAVFLPFFQIGASDHKGTRRSSKTKSPPPQDIVAETAVNQQRLLFQALMNAAQTLRVNGAPVAEPTVVPLASTSDEALPGNSPIPKVDTKSRSKRRLNNTKTSQSGGDEESKT